MLYGPVWVVDGNNLFTFKELKNALKYCKNISPGENGFYYNMLQNLSFVQQNIQRLLLNRTLVNINLD